MMKIISGLIRHGLTTAGGGLMAEGVLTADDLNLAVGAIMTVVGIIASIINKKLQG